MIYQRALPGPLLVCALLVALCGTLALAQDGGTTLPAATGAAVTAVDLKWGTSPDLALAQAAATGRPLYVYVWAKYNPECVRMSEQTLSHDLVAPILAGFELLAVDAHNSAYFPLFEKYKVPYYRMAPLGEQGELRYEDQIQITGMGVWPTSLFLDCTGQEVFRLYGYVPPQALAQTLSHVRALVKQWEDLRADPTSAVVEARLGHLYTQLAVYGEARRHLERALALDPQDATGVHAEVSLDLTILSVPDDPARAKRVLRDWQRANARHARRLEALYYEAVAEVADENLPAAEKLLSVFEQAAPGSAEAESGWYLPALQLLKLMRLPAS